MFPIIETINDVLPHIEGRKDFIVVKKDGYTVIDYVYSDKDSFDNPYRRECRGLKFGSDGKLLARPFHKFFNYGEKPETTEVDWDQPHTIYDKLDGSMIHPAYVNGELVFMTRMGVTDVANCAFEYATKDLTNVMHYFPFCQLCIAAGITPIFEYTGPNNRIVVPYKEEALTLLAMRDNKTGNYLPIQRKSMYVGAGFENIPTVRPWMEVTFGDYSRNPPESFIKMVRELPSETNEGVVVHFPWGFMKIKADEYVKFHRAKDSLSTEKRVLQLVLEGKTDDLMPLLSEADRKKLEEYSNEVNEALNNHVEGLGGTVKHWLTCSNYPDDRKKFADLVKQFWHPVQRSTCFRIYDGDEPREALVKVLLCYTASNAKVEQIREIIGNARWRT